MPLRKKILKGLNSEQREAVTVTEGPVLIVAGAGTGKTKAITTRVAHLLGSKKGLKPENILALTFTDKAADEMRERVEGIVGEDARDVWIYTFHAFARKIISENGSHIGIPANFKILDDTEKWILLKKLLPELKLEYYLQLADPSGVISSFVRFISRAKDELILPGEYRDYAGRLKKAFEKKKGRMDAEEAEIEGLEAKREGEIAGIYDLYQERALSENALDFGDLIAYTIKLFRERVNILSQYQKQFKYIVVDEFQDTNIAQIELLCMLAAKHNNICVVGDDDQAIYRFRGASYASFLKFKERFDKIKTVKLTQNYRSTKRILKTAGRLIANNGVDRYDPKKDLWTEKEAGAEVRVIVAGDYRDEARAVADEIQSLYKRLKGDKKRYSDMAVLYRAHMHKDVLLKELKARGIPAEVTRGVSLLDTDQIRDIVSYMKVVADSSDSVSLFRVLTSPAWNTDIEDLITISNRAGKDEVPIYDVIKELEGLEGIKKETGKRLGKFRADLKDLMRIAKRENASELFIALLDKSGCLTRLIEESRSDKDKRRAADQNILNIGRFYDFLIKYLKNNPRQNLIGFLEYLDCFADAGGGLEQEPLAVDEDAVRLMTVHSAKGLEFPHVFLISLVQRRFPTSKRGESIPFPDRLMKERLPQGDFHRQEERRLCYVAMTRAKERLYLSGIDKPRNRASMFIKEVLADDAVKNSDISYRAVRPSEDAEHRIDALLDRFKALEEEKGTNYKLPKPGKLSFTQIDTYNVCPLQYKFSYIYRVPKRRRNHLTFGTNMHSTLEDFFTLLQQGKSVDEKTLFEIFDKHWTFFAYDSKMAEKNYRREGERSIKKFFKIHKDMFQRPPLFLEKKMDLKVGDFTLDVRIDRIDDLGGGKIEIIDYKTGKPKDEKFAESSLQLSVYALACKEVLDLEPEFVSFYYLGPNKKVTTTRGPEDYKRTKEVIVDTGSKILSEEFEPTPGRICKWCDYKSICPAWDKE